MKTSSILAIFISGCLLVSFNSCKKTKDVIDVPSDQTPTGGAQSGGTAVTPTNPVTATTTCDYNFSDTTLTNHGWTKAFDDHFSGDLSNWYALTGGVTNEVMCNEPANAKIVNGELQISAKKETVTGPVTVGSTAQQTFNYTSASITSNQVFSASTATPKLMIVARVKMASGYGLTSVFNSFGTNWPTNGQINFFQVGGNDTREYSTNYFYGTQPSQNTVVGGMQYNPVNSDLSSCYHVFMTEWSQASLKYYIDGRLVETKTGDVPQLFNKQQSLGLSLPVGGMFYNNFVPANIQVGTMYVSYIKVFTSK
ncbi:glycoside hydrolase family 16 protein [Mucilaginibacter boryungensis]|uniref:Glycoside hydrolase family 16 protein n=1 Tax=Mucilaginibacter boryungensis TaxID=768480 RepID=A0ABR9XHE2_9SPHI|nr:glycoside hydrolase family 16 protein [Mucilaginibacter boryungensis]MBE9666809.1 glycoside hydrolase family 16 protein [Mucilaginibacter boryungensis]